MPSTPTGYTIEFVSYGLKVKWVLLPGANANDENWIGKRIDTSRFKKILVEETVTANTSIGAHILDQSFNEDPIDQGGDAHVESFGPSYPYKRLLLDEGKPWVGPRFYGNSGIHTFIFHCFF